MSSFFRKLLRPSAPAKNHRHKPSPKARLEVESLEDRLVPASLFISSTGLLTYAAGTGVANQLAITLDPATDTYRFTDREVINAPGFVGNGTNSVLVPNSRVAAMQILLGTGIDVAANTLTVQATKDPILVKAGRGNDSITLGGPQGMDSIQARITVSGEGGNDALTVNDQGAATGKSYILTDSFLTRAGVALVQYDTFETLNLNTTNLNDTISVRITSAGTVTRVNAGFGSDTLTVGNPSGGLAHIRGQIQFNGQDGTDALIVDDTANLGSQGLGRDFLVSATDIAWSGSLLTNYSAVESVTVLGSAFADQFFVDSTAAGVSTTIRAGGSNDSFVLGAATIFYSAPGLNGIQGTLTLDGGAGTDALKLRDESNSIGQTYTVTSTAVSRSGMAQVNYSALESLELNAGAASDVVNVRTTAAATPVTVNLGAGDNTANVGNQSPFLQGSTLSGIQGALTVRGNGVLNLNDNEVFFTSTTGGTTGRTYTVSPSAVSRSGAAQISYSGLKSVVLNATNADDKFNVNLVSNTLGNPSLTVNAGSGTDTFTMAAGSAGPATLNGQGGFDTLNYGLFTTGVRVNLALGTATGLAGISGIDNVTGGSANDIVIGDAGNNVLRGGAGRDLLIGAAGADQLLGDTGEDILIGNATIYDADSASLEAIMSEWARTDLNYASRIQDLKFGGGLNGATRLELTKVIEDSAQDSLSGGTDALDWFFRTGSDFITDLNQPGTEQVNSLQLNPVILNPVIKTTFTAI